MDTVIIEQPTRDSKSSPYLFIPLFEGDNGDPRQRLGHSRIAGQDPWGVKVHDRAVTVTVANAGLVASDLIRVDYEIRLCSNSAHGRADGFVVDHAREEHGSTMSDLGRIDFIPARSSTDLTIPIADLGNGVGWPDWLANIYFRARVSSLFTRVVPVQKWNFDEDPAVTEATLRLAP